MEQQRWTIGWADGSVILTFSYREAMEGTAIFLNPEDAVKMIQQMSELPMIEKILKAKRLALTPPNKDEEVV